MTSDTPKLKALHRLYCDLSGMDLPWNMDKELPWASWLRRGWDENDLRLVIKHIQAGISKGERHLGALKFSNLVWNLNLFEEDLALARALQRKPRPDPAREVLKATHRPDRVVSKTETTTAGEAAFKALQALKSTL